MLLYKSMIRGKKTPINRFIKIQYKTATLSTHFFKQKKGQEAVRGRMTWEVTAQAS